MKSLPTPWVNAQLIRWHWRDFSLHSLFVIAVFALQLVPGLVVKMVFDRLSGIEASAPPQASELALLIAVYLGLEALRIGLGVGLDYFGWSFRVKVQMLLRTNLFASLLNRRLDQALPFTAGEAINRFRDDVGEVADFPTWLPDQVGKWIAAGIAIIIMARINLPITLIIFVPLIGIMVFTRMAWGRILAYWQQGAEAADAVLGFLGEALGAVLAVKVAGAEEGVAEHLAELGRTRQRAAVGASLYSRLLESVNASAVTFGTGVMLLLAGAAITRGEFSVGDFALFTSYLWFTTSVPSELGTFYGDYKTQAISLERMAEIIHPALPEDLLKPGVMQNPPFATQEEESPLSPPLIRGVRREEALSPPLARGGRGGYLESLEVSGLTYHYPSSGRGIEDISFTLHGGDLTVITGRVGSGKTTLLRTLFGLLPLDAGEIRWNGAVVSDPSLFLRPPHAAGSPQNPHLFSETLQENILLGLSDDPQALQAALELAVFEQDVAQLEQGLATRVGPRGVRLSGGQVQRAAAARLFVRKPLLVVLDDVSSALDVETEQKLWERIANHPGFTVLAVSHRRPVLQRARQVIVLREGRVEGIGNLAELLESCAEMRAIWSGDERNHRPSKV